MTCKYEFAEMSFDPVTGDLSSDSGEPTRLPVQIARVLQILLDAAGELVTREDLYEALWGDQFVDREHGLNFCIRQLRIYLGDDARNPIYIETIRGRGYRFLRPVVAVKRLEDSVNIAETRVSRRTLAACIVAAVLSLSGSAVPEIARPSLDGQSDITMTIQEAQYLESRLSVSDVRRAILKYQSVVARDSRSAEAFAGLARSHWKLSSWGATPAMEALVSARDAARAALARDDSISDAHLTLGLATLYLELNWEAAGTHFRDAINRDAGSGEARLWMARYLAAVGRFDEALAESRSALATDPTSTTILGDMAWFHYFAGDYPAAIATAERVLALDPRLLGSLNCMQLSHLALGDEERARQVTETILRGVAGEEKGAELAASLASSPDWLKQAAVSVEEACPTRSLAVESARLYALAGDHASAIRLLRKGTSERLWWIPFVPIDPAFDRLRKEKGFEILVGEGSESGRGHA